MIPLPPDIDVMWVVFFGIAAIAVVVGCLAALQHCWERSDWQPYVDDTSDSGD